MSEIPASLAPFFQEYDLEKLTLERSAGTIIERTLQYGNRIENVQKENLFPFTL